MRSRDRELADRVACLERIVRELLANAAAPCHCKHDRDSHVWQWDRLAPATSCMTCRCVAYSPLVAKEQS